MTEAEQQEIDDELEEIKRLLDNKGAANTKKITKLACVLSSVVDVATAEKDLASLDKHLVTFYVTARNSKYKAGSILTFRQGLRRHYQDEMSIDIVKDDRFSYSTSLQSNSH